MGVPDKDAVLVGIVVMVAMTNLLDQALMAILIPVWAQEYGGGPNTIGILIAVQSAFAVLGAALAAQFGERMPRLKTYTIAFLIGGAPRFLILFPRLSIAFIISITAIAGLAIGFINPTLSAIIFERIPKILVGRVSSLISVLAWGLAPFGALLGGVAITQLDLPMSVTLAAAAYLAVTMMPLFIRSFRALAVRPEKTETTE